MAHGYVGILPTDALLTVCQSNNCWCKILCTKVFMHGIRQYRCQSKCMYQIDCRDCKNNHVGNRSCHILFAGCATENITVGTATMVIRFQAFNMYMYIIVVKDALLMTMKTGG